MKIGIPCFIGSGIIDARLRDRCLFGKDNLKSARDTARMTLYKRKVFARFLLRNARGILIRRVHRICLGIPSTIRPRNSMRRIERLRLHIQKLSLSQSSFSSIRCTSKTVAKNCLLISITYRTSLS